MKNYQSININTNEVDVLVTSVVSNDHPQPQDHLAPPFHSPDRPSSIFVGTFNLVASMVGGGVLSLPIVFQKCGVAFTTLAMVFSAYITYMSLIMLCYGSRRGGGSSYGEVVRSAFGEKAEEGVSWLLFVFLMFVIIAYMILVRDIWTPLVHLIPGIEEDGVDGDNVLLAIMVFLLPLLVQRSLHALRFNCYVGSASIFILCIALCRGGWQRIESHKSTIFDETMTVEDEEDVFAIDYFKMPSSQEILFSFPIVTLNFLCHFNIISIQNALIKPSRERIQRLTKYSIGVCFLLSYSFGLGGYLYAGSKTEGNILLNVPTSRQDDEDETEYILFLLGRIGCGTMIMFAVPMVTLPCREALLEVVDVWFHHEHHLADEASTDAQLEGNEKCCWSLFHQYNPSETAEDSAIRTENEVEILETLPEHCPEAERSALRSPSVLIRHDPIQRDYVFRNELVHYGSTLLITVVCYLGATSISGVAVVWSFIGSSMAFVIAFILPFGCFVVLESVVPPVAEGGDRRERWVSLAWAMLLLSIIGAVVCTVNNLLNLSKTLF